MTVRNADVLRATSQVFKIPMSVLVRGSAARRRGALPGHLRRAARARHVGMYVAVQIKGARNATVARSFGAHRTSVLYARRRVEARLSGGNIKLKDFVKAVRAAAELCASRRAKNCEG